MIWTDARIKTTIDLWNTGQSAAEIASALGGVTRNAVIGKLHRLRLNGDMRIKRQAISDNQSLAICELREKGHDWADIAQRTQLPAGLAEGHYHSIQSHLKDTEEHCGFSSAGFLR